jgi:actin-related protein
MRQVSLDIFYQNMIEYTLNALSEKFNKLDNRIETPLEIVVAGGTSMVPGFMAKFEAVLNSLKLPFNVKGVRHAANPFYAVSNGCLAKAIASEKRKLAQ